MLTSTLLRSSGGICDLEMGALGVAACVGQGDASQILSLELI